MAEKWSEGLNQDTDIQKQKNTEQQLSEHKVNPENTNIVKRLWFNLEKGEKIDQKTLEGKMGEQFDKMKNSVGDNPESQAKLDAIKKSFSQTMGQETDINEQLKLCQEFLKEYDIAASTEKGEYAQRAKMQSNAMEKEAKTDVTKTGERSTEIKKMITEIVELQLKEEKRKNEEKRQREIVQNSEKSLEIANITQAMGEIPWAGADIKA